MCARLLSAHRKRETLIVEGAQSGNSILHRGRNSVQEVRHRCPTTFQAHCTLEQWSSNTFKVSRMVLRERGSVEPRRGGCVAPGRFGSPAQGHESWPSSRNCVRNPRSSRRLTDRKSSLLTSGCLSHIPRVSTQCRHTPRKVYGELTASAALVGQSQSLEIGGTGANRGGKARKGRSGVHA